MDVKSLGNWESVKREFKFTDLLAIITVLLILVFLLMPGQIGPKGGSKKSTCLSNMKQIGVAFLIYASDNDGLYPSRGYEKVKIGDRPPEPREQEEVRIPELDWPLILQPYIKNLAMLRCPLDNSLKPVDPNHPDYSREYLTSYTLNGWAEYDLAQSDVSRPSNWVLLAERNNVVRGPKPGWTFDWWLWQGNVWPPTVSPDPTPKASEDLDLKRHSDKCNWAFGDGHVKSVPLAALWKAGSENAFWPTGK